jgi:hypothetical protein
LTRRWPTREASARDAIRAVGERARATPILPTSHLPDPRDGRIDRSFVILDRAQTGPYVHVTP